MTQIILASSSETRKALLDRLQLDYLAISPDIDESAKPNENAEQLAQRLSFEKALKIANDYPDAIVIGSDQVAYLAESPQQFIGKPYTEQGAIAQLQQQSGKTQRRRTAPRTAARPSLMFCLTRPSSPSAAPPPANQAECAGGWLPFHAVAS